MSRQRRATDRIAFALSYGIWQRGEWLKTPKALIVSERGHTIELPREIDRVG